MPCAVHRFVSARQLIIPPPCLTLLGGQFNQVIREAEKGTVVHDGTILEKFQDDVCRPVLGHLHMRGLCSWSIYATNMTQKGEITHRSPYRCCK